MDSTHCKDSRTIKFAIFGPVDYLLLILQDLAHFEKDLNLFDLSQATWRYLIGGYWFGRIKLLSRRILSGLCG
jgi:hypothetical protein